MPALYLVLNHEIPGLDSYVNGRSLSEDADQLEDAANRLSIPSLMSFFSMDPEEAAEIVESSGGDPSEIQFEECKWHEASAGLTTVRALRADVSQNLTLWPEASALLADLSDFERVLQAAQDHRIRWHLAVEY